jgi:hypothetical protein
MTIHSCSYHCHRPACIKAQRDELRDKLAALIAERDALRESLQDCLWVLERDYGSDSISEPERIKARKAIEAAKRQEGVCKRLNGR